MSDDGFAGCAAALVVRSKVLLVRQYRKAVARTTLELPGGIPEAGESPSDCVSREFLEETGLLLHEPTFLASILTSPTFAPEYNALFVASHFTKTENDREFEYVWLGLDDVLERTTLELIPSFDLAALFLIKQSGHYH